MKRLIAILLTGLILFSACGDGQTSTENEQADEPIIEQQPYPEDGEGEGLITTPPVTTEPPVTTTPPPPPLELVNEEAEELFNLLIDNKDVWEQENIWGGTLIDLDFDGTPEFLTYSGELIKTFRGIWDSEVQDYVSEYYEYVSGDTINIYKIGGDELTEFAKVTYNWRTGVTGNRSIFLYTDESGNKSWAIPYIIGERANHGSAWALFADYLDGMPSDSEPWEFRFSLFDFTDNQVTEYVKFSEKYTPNVSPADTCVFTIDGEVLTATAEELQEYEKQMEGYLEGLKYHEENPDDPEGRLSGPFSEPLEPSYPPVYRFYEIKGAFERSFNSAYVLNPNDSGYYDPPYWYDLDETAVLESLKRTVNAFIEQDESYLHGYGAFDEGAWAKPVIYLYPEETTDIEVRVTFPTGGRFTCTYPDYGDGWSVTAYPDGTLINKADEREYSYLYWEGEGPANWDFSSGFVVKGSDTAAFLQEKLEYLGLRPREYNEFIVYWLPIMQNNPYNLITFQTDEYEKNAPLFVSPKPDSVLRVFMVYQPLQNPINIPEQKLESFERTGFSVIEWGGAELDKNVKIHYN
ncbi:MAG: hypothetical protein FWG70_10335 [Oscillospiraceae bacterium]|nr:hypothetical protein [Oscillospiraceae bacterium]